VLQEELSFGNFSKNFNAIKLFEMDWKDKLSGLKAELPQVEETDADTKQPESPKKQKEPLRVELDKRNGKPATLVTEFQGTDDELKELAKMLKIKCGSGGSSRNGEILVQGDFRVKIAEILLNMGFKVKKINFK
jgi:Translation initiation factor 1 (eIF-1/SUI1) and related proteins